MKNVPLSAHLVRQIKDPKQPQLWQLMNVGKFTSIYKNLNSL